MNELTYKDMRHKSIPNNNWQITKRCKDKKAN